MLIPAKMTGNIVGILGLGRSGLAAAASLLAAGTTVFLADDHKVPEQLPEGARLHPWPDWPWAEIDLMVISPGIARAHPAAKRAAEHGVGVVSEIEIAMLAQPEARIVGITGTNGKSTTTALIGHCLEVAGIPAAVGGNIGDAACQMNDPGPGGVIVLELSSYQLETTPSLRTDVSVVLNISPDHLDRHGGMDGYVAAKAGILAALGGGGLAVLGEGDSHVRSLATAYAAAGQPIHIARSSDAPAGSAQCPALTGAHNAENAAAAALVLRQLGVDPASIDQGMASFAGLPHRLQHVASAGPIAFVNDSKATNGVAAARALQAFDNIYWIAGGLAKDDGIGAAAQALDHVTSAYLIGESTPIFTSALEGRCPATTHGDLRAATTAAFADAWAGGIAATVLLAPAAASFDQFDSFAVRGDIFTGIARQLAASVSGTSKRDAHA